MNVCHISHSFKKGGAGIAAGRIFQCIHDYYNFDLKLSSLSNDDISFPMNVIQKVHTRIRALFSSFLVNTLHSVPSGCIKDLESLNLLPSLNLFKLFRLVSHADIIHVHFFQFEFISIFELALINKPLVFTFHDLWLALGVNHFPPISFSSDYQAVSNLSLRTNLSILDKFMIDLKTYLFRKKRLFIVCPSQSIYERIKSLYIFSNAKIYVIPNPIPSAYCLESNKSLPRNPQISSRKLPVNVLVPGPLNFTSRKGISYLIDILRNPKIHENYKFFTFGSDSIPEELTSLPITNLGFISSNKLLSETFTSFDITLIPSICETFCQVAAESISCGTPVVGFKTLGVMDTVANKSVGYLSDSFTSDGLIQGLHYVSGNIQNDSHYYTESTITHSLNWSYKNVAMKYFDLYRNILFS